MSTAMQPRQQETRLVDWARSDDAHQQIAAAVGAIMEPDQFITHMLVAMQDPKVRNCSVRSQTVAFMQCAALGVLPTLNQVVLVPYKDEIKATVTWQGLKSLMERSPDILEVEPRLVHVADQFEFVDGVVRHSYDPFATNRQIASEKDIRGGYCRILYRNGRPPKYHITTAAYIAKCRKCAQTQNVWTTWFEAMALKTLLRDCYARRAVPIDPLVSARLERAFEIDDVNLGNDPNIDNRPTGRVSKTERLLCPDPLDDDPPIDVDVEPPSSTPEPDPLVADAEQTAYDQRLADYDMMVGEATTDQAKGELHKLITAYENLKPEDRTAMLKRLVPKGKRGSSLLPE